MITDRTDHAKFAKQFAQREFGHEQQARRLGPGGNNPPSPIESAKEALAELSAWLKEHPRFTDKAEADAAYAYVERTRVALGEARKQRDEQTKPHNEALSKIRAFFDLVREKTKTNPGGTLERAYTELKRRLTEYDNEVEALRIAEANRLAAEREAAEKAAREAEAAEQEAVVNAAQGECTDVGAAIENADTKFSDFQKAARAAAVAARDVPVRHASVMGGRAGVMRTVETPYVTDAVAAIKCMGEWPELHEVICKRAKLYRADTSEWPTGIETKIERRM